MFMDLGTDDEVKIDLQTLLDLSGFLLARLSTSLLRAEGGLRRFALDADGIRCKWNKQKSKKTFLL